MKSVNAKPSLSPDKTLRISRLITLFGSIFVALGSGTNYAFSAYAPQLGARLRISHTQLNIIGTAANMGTYTSGPVWGRVIDSKGPRIPLIGASICFLVGYLGIKKMYDDGIGDDSSTISTLRFTLLVACGYVAGSGSIAGLETAMSATAKSFPSSARATTTGLVMSGVGLSALMFSLLARTLFPGDTSTFLSTLAVGTTVPMVIGTFIVKPVPPPPTSPNAWDWPRPIIEDCDTVQSRDTVAFTGEPRVIQEREVDAGADADSTPLLSYEQGDVGLQHEQSIEDKDVLPDIHGRRLWLTPDFHLVFAIMAICSGVGIAYINNVGSISQALYARTHPHYDEVEASKWQVAQVSILSLGNFIGRLLIGLISDFVRTRLRIPRAYCLCLVSALLITSQAIAIAVSSVETLWIATLSLGLAYGSLLGVYPSILIEWFGLAHFSENWGYISFSSAVGGGLFSFMFGRTLDAHAPPQNTRLSLMDRSLSSVILVSHELSPERRCLDGRACYLGSLQVTLVACIVALGLSWWAGLRDGQKIKRRHG